MSRISREQPARLLRLGKTTLSSSLLKALALDVGVNVQQAFIPGNPRKIQRQTRHRRQSTAQVEFHAVTLEIGDAVIDGVGDHRGHIVVGLGLVLERVSYHAGGVCQKQSRINGSIVRNSDGRAGLCLAGA